MSLSVKLENIVKRFPGVVANDHITLSVEPGSVHSILGENGAGKSTLMKILYGTYRPDEGEIRIDGEPHTFESPQDAIDRGIGMIHQHFKLVDTMTLAENVILGTEPETWSGFRVDRKTANEEFRELSERYGFNIDPTAVTEDVSVGVQQRVEILKAIYRGADLLILDEPTAVLTPEEVESLFSIIEELSSQGKTIIFITHKLGEAMSASDTITVLRDGQNVGTLRTEETTEAQLAEMMVGRSVMLESEKEPHPTGDLVLSLDGVSVGRGETKQVEDVSLEVYEGEILGIAGVDGNGQTPLSEAVTGIRPISEGRIIYQGEDISEHSRRRRIDDGIVYIPPDRQKRGLVMDFDLSENALLGDQHHLPLGKPNRDNEGAEHIIDEYDVRAAGIQALTSSLSGGNQQKFLVGREIEREPDLIVASNPTRGLDVGSIEYIHEQLLRLRRNDQAVLMVSSKLDELRQLSDRLAVIYEGEIVGIVDPDDSTEREIGLLMAGESVEQADLEEKDELPGGGEPA